MRHASALISALSNAALRRRRRRHDRGTTVMVSVAGYGVVLSLALIFIFLAIEVLPLLRNAGVGDPVSYQVPGPDAPTVHITSERYQALAVRITDQADVVFFEPNSGEVVHIEGLNLDAAQVVSFAAAEPRSRLFAVGLDDGRVVVSRHADDVTFFNDEQQVIPKLEHPLGSQPLLMDAQGAAITHLAIQEGATGIAVAATTADGRLLLSRFSARRSFLTGDTEYVTSNHELTSPPDAVTHLLLDITMRILLVADERGTLHYYDVSRPAAAQHLDSRQIMQPGHRISALSYLLGTVSVIVGGSDGSLQQYFLVRDADNIGRLTQVREFTAHPLAIRAIVPEFSRKGFAAVDEGGYLGLHYATSARTLRLRQVSDRPLADVSIAPRNNHIMWLDDGDVFHYASLRNRHPESSLSALWNRVWYEGRNQSEYVWQSSSATDEFEPKFSLVPLSVGTLKAAFYAMLFAMPLAIFGAIYTAYFMSPKMRGVVKPTIEVMEALPTVILGFLAGLWLAPFMESHLPAVFSLLIALPVVMVITAWLWMNLPAPWRSHLPTGWEAAILIPVILFTGWFAITLSPLVEVWFFNGSMRQWFTDVGITYDQRNALVVGIAMGFAVIPTIFSIAEDAVFNVPKHLTQGSLALGATPWQTVLGVVILTASPGIFSAVMIGFGRAIGETMIVLMATGNSPVVNFNIFEGMRTLSANIAVEMPEAAVGGTHYRLLFLAALVLFAFTFVLNTIAEVVRQRLRTRYSSL